MGYKVLPSLDKEWGKRDGLEGPFNFTGRVLYYDPQVGQYYDPTTDFYVGQDEMDAVHQRIVDILAS
jgi:hypothetical protein